MNLASLQPYTLDIALASGAVAIICFILAVSSLARASSLRRKLNRLREISSAADLEQVFTETKDAVQSLQAQLDAAKVHISQLEKALNKKVSTPVIRRYNAFSEVGSDLSYSVAFLDDQGDGVVLTSIYGREDSVTYGKPIEAGESPYLLTEEEQSVISGAMGTLERQPARIS
ncbi:Protein of unknown function [Alicyclobacillus hesperidum]|uniref:DUF4446 family protein n=1 Tax=Alicyclobacillus hesperidum TaxID=89784 RepID=A0A1H2X534_9BACL|nr:DUF4446 family protein [Alicyclobacillus hesperidum]SDW87369.1 Protein of unknown function [Alicyclobacillus hesperidum]